jgi:hypothetical protein
MQQLNNIADFFDKIFDQFLPDSIIELGTGDGEFIDIIGKLVFDRTNDVAIYTFDNRDHSVVNPFINYQKCHIFDNVKYIKPIFKGRVLLLCDNGDKAKEIKTFSKFLKAGDVLMAHDYAYSIEYFNEHKFWRTCELTDADIDFKGFERFNQNLMIQAGWLSLIKTIE